MGLLAFRQTRAPLLSYLVQAVWDLRCTERIGNRAEVRQHPVCSKLTGVVG